MLFVREYLDDAVKHEEVFRNLLRTFDEDFKKSEGLDPEASLEQIFQEYSAGDRYGKWTIFDFRRGPYEDKFVNLTGNEALLATGSIAILSGYGKVDKYLINKDDSVVYEGSIASWMS
jgi:hypothetical protein